MTSKLPLEDFGTATRKSAAPAQENSVPTDAIDSLRLEAYEQGYKAGWDDALKSQVEEQARIGADFARTLQDLGFTYYEARSHVMRTLEPLLKEIVETLLPALIKDTLGQAIIEELLPIAHQAADTPIELTISPRNRPAIEGFLSENSALPLIIKEQPSLADGQAHLRFGEVEKHVDLTDAVRRIESAIAGIYQVNERALDHG